jgi:phosphoribosylaminoimidazole carboxylase (NCAIR synthetase)
MDACITSQFEQLIRAVCGLPLGSSSYHSPAIMKNLIGEDINKWEEFIQDPDTKIHIYGKTEARKGRKMGHVTWLSPLEEELVITSVDHHNPPPIINPASVNPASNLMVGPLVTPGTSNVTPFIKRV